MDYKHSKMLGDDGIRIPFNCDQGFEEYYLVFVGKTPYEHERHLDKVVCARGPLNTEDHECCRKTLKDICWKDQAGWQPPRENVSQAIGLKEQIMEGSRAKKAKKIK
jgi:hypothetical protein